jgi:hypothetical protein
VQDEHLLRLLNFPEIFFRPESITAVPQRGFLASGNRGWDQQKGASLNSLTDLHLTLLVRQRLDGTEMFAGVLRNLRDVFEFESAFAFYFSADRELAHAS